MTLIVGLGNPGSKYKLTRHNIGFLVIDSIIKELSPVDISKKSFYSLLYKKDNLLLMKPQTYMNLSGEAVYVVSKFYKCDKIIVIYDDIDLDFGTIKYKYSGGNGGHNGLKSIDKMVGNGYFRVRIGISKPSNKNMIADYVLSSFNNKESSCLDDIIDSAKNGALSLISKELKDVCSNFTRKKICLD